MNTLLLAGLFIPLASFFVLMFFGSTLGRVLTGALATLAVLASFICFSSLLFQDIHPQLCNTLFNWFHVGSVQANFTICLDSLSLLMALIITGVGFLIHLYSNGYMDHDEHYSRYFACLNLFIFSMLLLVLAGDLAVLFVGWEGVGVVSYLLIGFWYEKPEAAKAAVKAFVVNRIGDLGFLIALIMTYQLFGTSNISDILAKAPLLGVGTTMVTILTLLYFVGAMGKSAQLPLQSWLPDAMAGPTPVSALIHAATMVTAGVYLIVRMHPLFLQAPTTLQVVGTIGALTALYAAIVAVKQTDLKKVLAYSTVSQLGLMFMACGAGAFYAAMFHLTTHAFIKALLFLSAGNVVHMLHGETEMSKMGGLSKVLPKTNWLFLLGVLALSGIPPFAAFFSKDLILEQEFHSGHKILFGLGLLASILTAFYLMRAYLLTFMGNLRSENEEVKEAPWIMIGPISILALGSILGGLLGYPYEGTPLLESFLQQIKLSPAEEMLDSGYVMTAETWVAVGGGLLGLFSAIYLYFQTNWLQRSSQWLKNAMYVDWFYSTVLVTPLKQFSSFIQSKVEPLFFEGSLDYSADKVLGLSGLVQKTQNSQVRSYAAWIVLGMGFIVVYLLIQGIK